MPRFCADRGCVGERKQMTDKDFIKWVIDEIWDEELWELNHGGFAEIACRKLVKLGYLGYDKETNSYYIKDNDYDV